MSYWKIHFRDELVKQKMEANRNYSCLKNFFTHWGTWKYMEKLTLHKYYIAKTCRVLRWNVYPFFEAITKYLLFPYTFSHRSMMMSGSVGGTAAGGSITDSQYPLTLGMAGVGLQHNNPSPATSGFLPPMHTAANSVGGSGRLRFQLLQFFCSPFMLLYNLFFQAQHQQLWVIQWPADLLIPRPPTHWPTTS